MLKKAWDPMHVNRKDPNRPTEPPINHGLENEDSTPHFGDGRGWVPPTSRGRAGWSFMGPKKLKKAYGDFRAQCVSVCVCLKNTGKKSCKTCNSKNTPSSPVCPTFLNPKGSGTPPQAKTDPLGTSRGVPWGPQKSEHLENIFP